ncbi:hypothetical protein BGW38_009514 [Lunasporangiospora selenospora]|uniref:Major Facilitator Superfamily protein n=1 Tax=Lunasporangiospora selenospora TaxID=979761 RepID=A0A9P6KFX3_9FUNG|nr:hypothetical protein BGW38_009514 [Lunasporangiospora selenospora]
MGSVFNTLIDNELYGNADGTPANAHKAAITFYIALGCFGVSSSIMGPWLERHGPRKAGLLGATLFLLGNLTTALGIYLKQISLVYIGYGIFGGLGLGISYISPVSALQKWFPDRRGVAAGLAVSGFGAGSIVMAKVPDPLSAAVGLPLTFVILGLAYFLVMAVCAFVFRVPPPGYIVNGVNVWAIRVDVDEEANEVHSSENHDQGLSEITIDERQSSSQPNSCSRVFIENKGEAPAISSILHTLHPLQRSLNSQKSMDDFLVPPISPVSNTTTVLPSALNSASNSRRSSTHTAAMHASLDPSISMNLMDSLYSREFRLMYIMFLGNTMAGVVIISRLANIATDIFGHSKNSASTIVSINGGFNLLGRLLFASISDKIGRKSAYMVMLGCQAIALATLPVIMQESVDSAFLLTIWLLTSCYGGGFGCIPAFLCDMFGPSNIGPLHGVILTSWSLSSVGAGLLFTGVYNYLLENGYTIHDSFIYAVNLYWMLGCVCVGVLVAIFVRVDMLDRLLPSLPGEYFHARILRRIVRFGQFGIQKMTQEQEQQAWTNYVAHRQMEEEHALNSNEKGRI